MVAPYFAPPRDKLCFLPCHEVTKFATAGTRTLFKTNKLRKPKLGKSSSPTIKTKKPQAEHDEESTAR
jgi:hypothetical protein